MRDKTYHIYLDSPERKLLIHSLVELKNQLIQQGRYTDCIDELIFQVINAPTKRMKIEYVQGKFQSRLFLLILRVGGFFAFSGTVYIPTLTQWLNLCKRDKALAHFEGGYRSGQDGQKRKNEESFNHFKCITRYYIQRDIQWKGV